MTRERKISSMEDRYQDPETPIADENSFPPPKIPTPLPPQVIDLSKLRIAWKQNVEVQRELIRAIERSDEENHQTRMQSIRTRKLLYATIVLMLVATYFVAWKMDQTMAATAKIESVVRDSNKTLHTVQQQLQATAQSVTALNAAELAQEEARETAQELVSRSRSRRRAPDTAEAQQAARAAQRSRIEATIKSLQAQLKLTDNPDEKLKSKSDLAQLHQKLRALEDEE